MSLDFSLQTTCRISTCIGPLCVSRKPSSKWHANKGWACDRAYCHGETVAITKVFSPDWSGLIIAIATTDDSFLWDLLILHTCAPHPRLLGPSIASTVPVPLRLHFFNFFHELLSRVFIEETVRSEGSRKQRTVSFGDNVVYLVRTSADVNIVSWMRTIGGG